MSGADGSPVAAPNAATVGDAAPAPAKPATAEGTNAKPAQAPDAAKSATDRNAAALKLVRGVLEPALAFVRKHDPDAAADLDGLRRRQVTQPVIAVVGETKRGKSSLVNALLGVPGLSPVDAAVATAAYLEFVPGEPSGAQAFIPGQSPVAVPLSDLRDWATVLGHLPDDARPPRHLRITHPAPLLRYLSLLDTPGAGGLDPLHAEIAMDAVQAASALLFVVDASAPLSRPELDFLVEASKRVNFVVFVLTKVDAYPGWRTILADNRAQLQTHAPRFASAGWFPVSARLAELAATTSGQTRTALASESGIGPLHRALVDLAGRGHVLEQANVLRAIRSEIVRMDQELGQRVKATDPDPADAARVREERAALAARKRTESRQWSLTLQTLTQRARVDATTMLREQISAVQEDFLNRIEKANGEALKTMPAALDRTLHVLSLRLSHDLQARFRGIGEQVLAQVFPPWERQAVLGRINAQLQHTLGSKPRRDSPSGDGAIVVMSSASMAMMAGRYGMAGAAAIGLAGGLIVPVLGVGLGLAAGAFMVWKRKAMANRTAQRGWLREVLGEARAALGDEVARRFTDLQYALTVALDEAIERRIAQLDARVAEMDKALAEDKASRTRRRAGLISQREAVQSRLKQVDEVLVRVRSLAPRGVPTGEG